MLIMSDRRWSISPEGVEHIRGMVEKITRLDNLLVDDTESLKVSFKDNNILAQKADVFQEWINHIASIVHETDEHIMELARDLDKYALLLEDKLKEMNSEQDKYVSDYDRATEMAFKVKTNGAHNKHNAYMYLNENSNLHEHFGYNKRNMENFWHGDHFPTKKNRPE